MGTTSFVYKLVLFLHISSAIIGFGSVFFLGVFGQEAGQRKGREGLALTQVSKKVGETFATPFIYATFVFGIALVLLSRGAVTFEMTWIWLSILLFVLALGVSHGLHRPNLRKIVILSEELAEMGPPTAGANKVPVTESPSENASGRGAGPPVQVIELAERGKRAALYGTVLNLAMLAIVVLMVFKPGV